MRDLWRKTTALFWESPILWLPVVCADLLAFCFTRVQKLLTWQLINSFLLGHSALAGQAIPSVVHDSDRVDGYLRLLAFSRGRGAQQVPRLAEFPLEIRRRSG
jgi:hypothetical protein